MSEASQTMPLPAGWLRGPIFDWMFIVGIAVVALFATFFAMLDISLFVPILMADIWLLGAHHVIATYTRLCFDRESFRQHWFLVLGLPVLVFGTTLLALDQIGVWLITSTYLYWQWFHYTAQSWGVSQVYRRKSGLAAPKYPLLDKAAFYLFPLWGILHRSWQAPETFLGQELWVVPVPRIAVDVVATLAIVSLIVWFAARARDVFEKRLPFAYTLYVCTHIAMFGIGYLAIDDVTHGWLLINIWHNAQYVIFVWLFNTKRFHGQVDKKAEFLSFISQPKHWYLYFGVCLILSTALYKGIEILDDPLTRVGLPLLVFYQTLNFHHYIVDGRIWKMRQPRMQKTLGLPSS